MKIFLDSADPEEIKQYARWPIIDGVTTTPTFFRRLGYNDTASVIREIQEYVRGEIHIEALGNTVKDIVAAGRRNRDLGDNIVSKVPVGPRGLEAAAQLEEEGIHVNLHLVFSVNQAVLGAKAGASYVCPLMGRMNDAGLNSAQVIRQILEALQHYPELKTQVMVSSIRNTEDVRRSFLMGAPVLTIPGKVLGCLFDSPLTDKAHSILAVDTQLSEPVHTRMIGREGLPVLAPGVDAHEVMVKMTVKRVGIVALVEEGKLVGVITDGDLRRHLAEEADSRSLIAEEIMTRNPVVVGLDDLLGNAMDLMRERRVNEVLVVDSGGAPCGMVSLHDLMTAGADR